MRRVQSTQESANASSGFQPIVTRLIRTAAFLAVGYFVAQLLWRGAAKFSRGGVGNASGLALWQSGMGRFEQEAPGLREHPHPTEDSTQQRAQIWAEEAQRTPLNRGEERSFQE